MTSRLMHPIILALAVTGLNAMKPAVVDDSAYLLLAKDIAAHPADPYGGTLFWYVEPQPAMDILAPIVLPAWLALGISIFGDKLVLLKLWLFPFILLLACSLRILARAFCPRYSPWVPAVVLFSPFVLPLISVMLDIPSMALSMGALAVFVRKGNHWWAVMLAGVLAGLAMQTKYTAFAAPVVLAWYGLTHRRIVHACVAVVMAVVVFASWEMCLHAKYGTSHFVYHAFGPGSQEMDWDTKIQMLKTHMKYAGGLGLGMVMIAMGPLGVPRKVIAGFGVTVLVGLLALVFLPYSQAIISVKPNGVVGVDLGGAVFQTLGVVWLGTLGLAARVLVRKWPSRATLFVFGWLLVECLLAFGLTPFTAARRVIGVEFAAAFVLLRSAEVWGRRLHIPVPRSALLFAITLGFSLFVLDTYDAQPEARFSRQSATYIRTQDAKPRMWFNGHWGFQYACVSEGMIPVIPNQSELQPGDWLVFPEIPEDGGFYRPYHGGAKFKIDFDKVIEQKRLVWDDWISATTVPTMYGGTMPIIGRDHPRLVVVVYQVVKPWVPKRVP